MSLTLALQTALSGLAVNQKALSIISQNIANANTVGYTRKSLDTSSVVINNGIGAGVKIDNISRKVDDYLEKSIRSSTASSASAQTASDYLQRLQIYLGEPGASNSLDKQVSAFFDALQSLAETPESVSFSSQVVATGSQMANTISGLANNIQGLRYQADQDISTGITQFNETLKKLKVVNTAIAQAKTYGNPSSELLDKRDTLLGDVSSFMDAQVIYQPDGQAFVYTRNGSPLVSEELQQLDYTGARSVTDFNTDAKVNDITIRHVNQNGTLGEVTGKLVIGGTQGHVDSSKVSGGQLQALLNLRDTTLPGFTDSLDQLAGTIRDQFNAVHNAGSSYPGASNYTAERAMLPTDYTGFSGSIQIALLNADGTPHASLYSDETQAMRPLTLDLSKLDATYGDGKPTLQSVVDEINNYFGTPHSKVSLGNMNQIQMASLTNNIPDVPPNFSFDFGVENISGSSGKFYVTDVAVADDTGTDITNVTSTQPQIALDNANTYTTTANSNVVTITTAAAHGLKAGDTIYLGDPGAGPFNGLSGAQLSGYFTITNVTSSGFDISVQGSANATGAVGASGITAMPPYDTLQTGENRRTGDNGVINANLAGNVNSQYYDFTVHYGVVAADGTVSTGTATYRVARDQNILNQRFSASSVTGAAVLTQPSSNQTLLRATLVDADGKEIPQVNGKYSDVPGYLKIISEDPNSFVATSDIDSKEVGVTGLKTATNQSFFQYFGLNNFFVSKDQAATGGTTVKGAAMNFAIEQRLLDQPSLVSSGTLARSNQPTDPTKPPVYTYERFKGDNSLAQALAKVGTKSINFDQAGGLPNSTMSLTNYSGQLLAYVSNVTTNAETDYTNKQTLTSGLKSRSDSISGVNLDEELANTIVYQNAYTASARIITVTNQLFDTLLSSFGR